MALRASHAKSSYRNAYCPRSLPLAIAMPAFRHEARYLVWRTKARVYVAPAAVYWP